MVVAVEAGPCVTYRCDVGYGDGQDYREHVGHVHFAVQQFVHVEEYWEESDPWKNESMRPLKSKLNRNATYIWAVIICYNYVKTVKKHFYSSREVRNLKEAVKSVQTVVVESGATSNKGRGGNCEPASPISLHTVP